MGEYFSVLLPDAPVDEREVRRLARHGCLDIHRVGWPCCYLADDGMRMLCLYKAKDAESVRFVLRHQGFADTSVFPARCRSCAPVPAAADDRVVVEINLLPANPERPQATARAVLKQSQLPVLWMLEDLSGASLVLVLSKASKSLVLERLRPLGIEPEAIWYCSEIAPHSSALFPDVEDAVDSSADSTADSGKSRAGVTATCLDAVIIGAGLSGISALRRLAGMGLQVRGFESAADVGGVWHWNRYPGARVDSETYSYALSFSGESDQDQDWDWSELFCAQPEIERYLQHTVDHFDLRRHFSFNTSVCSADYDENSGCWTVSTDSGERVSARHLIIASGTLSRHQFPDYPGMESFAGQSSHTALWPEAGIPLAGRRVGVIGTGASGVQVIQAIASEVDHLTVFQRTPTYCIPQRNRRLSDQDRQRIRQAWPETLAACRDSYGGFIHDFDKRSGLAVSTQKREALFESWWKMPGFSFWLGNFADLMMNAEVNEFASEFARRKIRERLTDPAVATRLMPDHPFGSKRIPLENGYYEVYNRDNVDLVDLRETPIEAVTPVGIRTSGEHYPLDVLIYATGFDAGTGAFDRVDIRGQGGLTIADHWSGGPRTFLGMMASGFPNLYIVNGPQNPAGLCNATRCIEHNVDWIADAIEHLRTRGLTRMMPSAEAERRWTEHVEDAARGTVLCANRNSWFFGANTPGKPRRVVIYAPGARQFREHCEDVKRRSYVGCILS